MAAMEPRQLPRAKERLATVPDRAGLPVGRQAPPIQLPKAVILPCPILSAPSSSKR